MVPNSQAAREKGRIEDSAGEGIHLYEGLLLYCN